MKKIVFALSLAVGISVGLNVYQLVNRDLIDKVPVKSPFDVNFNESVDELKKVGFREDEEPFQSQNQIRNKMGDALVYYTIDPDMGIFDKSVVGLNIGVDSVSVAKWLERHGAFMWSPIFHSNGVNRFFAKSVTSGQLFSGIIRKDYTVLNIDYPDNGVYQPSLKRKVLKNGLVVISDKKLGIYVERNDFE